MRLYDITEEMEALDGLLDSWASNHEGDISEFPLNDEFERLEGERVEKLLNLAVWHKDLISKANAFKDEIKRLQGRQKALNNKAEGIKEYIDYNLQSGEKLSDNRCELSYRKSSQVVIDIPVDTLPVGFVKIEMSPDKVAIKEYVKENPETVIAHIEEKENLQIK